jgi:hypothetical protein
MNLSVGVHGPRFYYNLHLLYLHLGIRRSIVAGFGLMRIFNTLWILTRV